MMYTQGQIVLIPFPFTNQSGSKKRPALVISTNEFNKKSSDIILVQLTTGESDDGNSIAINNSVLTTPLNYISEIRCHKILVAEQSIIIKPISNIKHHVVKKVVQKISEIIKA